MRHIKVDQTGGCSAEGLVGKIAGRWVGPPLGKT